MLLIISSPGWIWERRFHSRNAWNVSSPHDAGGISKRNNHRPFWVCVWGKLGQGNHVIIVTSSVSKKLRFQNVFGPQKPEKPARSNRSGLKSTFEECRFSDGLMWTVGLTVEIQQRFQIDGASVSKNLEPQYWLVQHRLLSTGFHHSAN